LDQKLATLDQGLSDWQHSTTKRIRTLTDKIVDYATYLEEDRRTQTFIAETQLKEVKAIESLIV